MAGRNAAFEQARKLIEIEAAAEQAEWQRRWLPALAGFADRMAVAAEFLQDRAAMPARILRLHGGARERKRERERASDQRRKRPWQPLHCETSHRRDHGAPVGIKLGTPMLLRLRSNLS